MTINSPSRRASRIIVTAALSSGACLAVSPPGSASAQLPDCVPTVSRVGSDTVVVFSAVGQCLYTIPAEATDARLIVVGGGGAGGRSNENSVGGGGGGGVIVGADMVLAGRWEIVVGNGGSDGDGCPVDPDVTNGGDSSLSNGTTTIVAYGGGRGAGCGDNGTAMDGGSGGGGHSSWVPLGGPGNRGDIVGPVSGSVLLYGSSGGGGYDGEGGLAGGGGGGASQNGENGDSTGGGDGGEGVTSDITGTSVVYGSGGGATGTASSGVGGTNAGNGDATGPSGDLLSPLAGVPGTGGGGGGSTAVSGTGGSGVVVIRWTSDESLPSTGQRTPGILALAAGLVVAASVTTGVGARRRRRAQ